MTSIDLYGHLLGQLFASMLPGQKKLSPEEARALDGRLRAAEGALHPQMIPALAREEARKFRASMGRCAWCGGPPHEGVEVEW